MNEKQSSTWYWVATVIAVIVIILLITIRPNKPVDTANLNYSETMTTSQTTSGQPLPPNPTSTKTMQTVTMKTNMGEIVIKLDIENTPITAQNFIKLASAGFYNGTRFHRVIDGFMIQGGDPQSADITKKDFWGTGDPGYKFDDEIKPKNNNARGTISMANSGPNTNGSQFFINTADNTFLNPKHTVFGTVTSGMDVVDAISKSETDGRDRPINDVIINEIILQ